MRTAGSASSEFEAEQVAQRLDAGGGDSDRAAAADPLDPPVVEEPAAQLRPSHPTEVVASLCPI
jgi:hypothetical protein